MDNLYFCHSDDIMMEKEAQETGFQCDATTSSIKIPSVGSSDATTVCSCQHSSRRRGRGRFPIMNSSNSTTLFFMIIMPIFLSYFTCCISAWPILNQRRSYNYVLPSDYDLDVNQWALAAQPGVPEAYPVADAYYDIPALNQDNYGGDALYEDPEEPYPMQYFSPNTNAEPEEELELEELKHQRPYIYEKRRPNKGASAIGEKVAVSSSPSSHSVSSTLSPATSTAATPADRSSATASIKSDTRKYPTAPLGSTNGQKEIAMLRPPSTKSHHITIEEPEEPKISVAQRSPSIEKPSAYDRLRKYLSLDDALKKEYQQRRANAMNRHTKRESVSSIITESDNLTGQLNSLKKKID